MKQKHCNTSKRTHQQYQQTLYFSCFFFISFRCCICNNDKIHKPGSHQYTSMHINAKIQIGGEK